LGVRLFVNRNMRIVHLLYAWRIAMPISVVLGYTYPQLGAIFVVSLVALTAIANAILEFNSTRVGRHVALMAGATAMASCVGAASTRNAAIALPLIAAACGYLFSSVRVRFTTSSESESSPPRDLSGRGGDFGGGGASGKY
jgi:uncharacterized membrane protein YgcG